MLTQTMKFKMPIPFLEGCRLLVRLIDLSPPPTPQESEADSHALINEVEHGDNVVLK